MASQQLENFPRQDKHKIKAAAKIAHQNLQLKTLNKLQNLAQKEQEALQIEINTQNSLPHISSEFINSLEQAQKLYKQQTENLEAEKLKLLNFAKSETETVANLIIKNNQTLAKNLIPILKIMDEHAQLFSKIKQQQIEAKAENQEAIIKDQNRRINNLYLKLKELNIALATCVKDANLVESIMGQVELTSRWEDALQALEVNDGLIDVEKNNQSLALINLKNTPLAEINTLLNDLSNRPELFVGFAELLVENQIKHQDVIIQQGQVDKLNDEIYEANSNLPSNEGLIHSLTRGYLIKDNQLKAKEKEVERTDKEITGLISPLRKIVELANLAELEQM